MALSKHLIRTRLWLLGAAFVLVGGAGPAEADKKSAAPISVVAKRTKGKAKVGKPLPVRFQIKNQSSKEVTIVRSLDGSDAGWRSPKITIEVRDAKNKLVEVPMGGRCGMVNPLMEEDFVTLAPKKSHTLLGEGSFGHYVLRWAPTKAGRYTVTLRYDVSFSEGEKGQADLALLQKHKPLRGVYESKPLPIVVSK